MNTPIQVPMWKSVFLSLGSMPKSATPGSPGKSYSDPFLLLKITAELFSRAAVLSYIPTNNIWVITFLIIGLSFKNKNLELSLGIQPFRSLDLSKWSQNFGNPVIVSHCQTRTMPVSSLHHSQAVSSQKPGWGGVVGGWSHSLRSAALSLAQVQCIGGALWRKLNCTERLSQQRPTAGK